MKTKNKRNNLGEKGITLIALVVTIVVLLILAGVSINALFGNNGIIEKAQEAQNKMDEAQQKDSNSINQLSNWLDDKINTKKDTETEKTEGKYKLKNIKWKGTTTDISSYGIPANRAFYHDSESNKQYGWLDIYVTKSYDGITSNLLKIKINGKEVNIRSICLTFDLGEGGIDLSALKLNFKAIYSISDKLTYVKTLPANTPGILLSEDIQDWDGTFDIEGGTMENDEQVKWWLSYFCEPNSSK